MKKINKIIPNNVSGFYFKEKFMTREKRDYYDKNSNNTGVSYFKGDKAPEGMYPMVVMVCIQNNEGKFLMQKRVPEKGGDWGVTGGHPKSGETPLQGMLTEIKEEIGQSEEKKEPEENTSENQESSKESKVEENVTDVKEEKKEENE